MTSDHARKQAIRAAKKASGDLNHRQAAAAVRDREASEREDLIAQVMDEEECTREEAIDMIDDPRNQVMCNKCGWTYGMVCPECPGCGCYNGRCSGWRHHEFADDDPDNDDRRCPDCGGDRDIDPRYGCDCYSDED